jgi:hypothetical protein
MLNAVRLRWVLCGLLVLAGGCGGGSYYQVTDPASGKMYYTTKVAAAGKAGAVKIKDDKTGGWVTLQSSEVREISSDEYQAAVRAQRPS